MQVCHLVCSICKDFLGKSMYISAMFVSMFVWCLSDFVQCCSIKQARIFLQRKPQESSRAGMKELRKFHLRTKNSL